MENSENSGKLTFDDLYVTPFTEVRVYDRDGNISYEPIARGGKVTGVGIVDRLMAAIAAGHGHKTVMNDFGLDSRELKGVLRLLTGMEFYELQRKFVLRAADELLRYTDLPISEVAVRSHASSEDLLRLLYRRYYRCTPSERRSSIRRRGDLGRYR